MGFFQLRLTGEWSVTIIPIFSSELASSFIDSGAGLVLSTYMVCFSCSIEQRKQICSCKANSLGEAWCSYNERTRLLTNCLHGKAAELCLANS